LALLAETVKVPPGSGKWGESESGSSSNHSNVLATFEPRVKEGNLRYPSSSSGSKRIKYPAALVLFKRFFSPVIKYLA
jgi:hypothetical protein